MKQAIPFRTRAGQCRQWSRWRAFSSWSIAASCFGLCTAIALAVADPPASPVPDVPPADAAPAQVQPPTGEVAPLGVRFESQSAGISFQPRAGMVLVPPSGDSDVAYVGTWGEPKLKWKLTLGKAPQSAPTPLAAGVDNFGKSTPGLLDTTVARLKVMVPGGKVLRQDLTNIANGGAVDPHHPGARAPNVGLIAIRYTDGAQTYLSQQALIQASERLYYLLTYTTPGNRHDEGAEDPGERSAVETFNAMLDSVLLLDRSAIKAEQDKRLVSTRFCLLNIVATHSKTPMKDVLVGEQWLRVLKDGKDVGYTYITEETAAGIPRPLNASEIAAGKSVRDLIRPGDGILIGIRARMMSRDIRSDKTKGDIRTDNATWFYASPDMRHEEWSRVIVSDDFVNPHKSEVRELGSSDRRTKPKLIVPRVEPGTLPGPERPHEFWVDQDDFQLNVTVRTDHDSPPTITRELSPWYIPQAADHLLPRLVMAAGTKQYLFATYVSGLREVMNRYVDVLPQAQVTFNGQTMRATRIKDRLGIDGSVTTHYMSPQGAYLGSENLAEKIVVIPSDADTLTHIWKSANLSNPNGVDKAQRPAAAGPPVVVPPADFPAEKLR